MLSPITAREPDSEPFGLRVTSAPQGPVHVKWQAVEKDIRADRQVLQACIADRQGCPAAAVRFLAIIDDARARQGLDKYDAVNRAVNETIGSKTDLVQHRRADLWSSPLATFRSGFGDCEDFAIAKYVALDEAGISTENLRLTIVMLPQRKYHVVLAGRLDHHWLILDTFSNQILEDIATGYVPRFVIDHRGVREFRPPDHHLADASSAVPPNPGMSCR